jgi:hypothetical protein
VHYIAFNKGWFLMGSLLSFKATSGINAYIHDYGTFHVFYHSFSNDYWTAFYAAVLNGNVTAS